MLNALVILMQLEDGRCRVHCRHPHTQELRPLDLGHDYQRVEEGIQKVRAGHLIQNALGFLTPDEREFLMSGYYGHEYDELYDESPYLGEEP